MMKELTQPSAHLLVSGVMEADWTPSACCTSAGSCTLMLGRTLLRAAAGDDDWADTDAELCAGDGKLESS